MIDDSRLDVGVKAFANLVLDFKLNANTAAALNSNSINFDDFSAEQISIEDCGESKFYETPLQTFQFGGLIKEDLTARLCEKS